MEQVGKSIEQLDVSKIVDAIGKVFNDLEGFGNVLKAIVEAFYNIGEMFKDF